MKKLSIRPVLEFIAAQGRDHLTAGDWAQLTGIIEKRLAVKKARQKPWDQEAAYLKVIAHVGQLFKPPAKIKNTAVINAINNYLQAEGYAYDSVRHPPRHTDNTFYTKKQQPRHSYDIAFYNRLATAKNRPAHHTRETDELLSVFYMRCEETAEQILIGNLQIDDTKPEHWESPDVGRILLKPKNIYGMMVQQALQHAINTGKKEILFQSGDANDIAQWGNYTLKERTVTPRNYKKFMQDYQARLDKFGPNGVRVGEIFPKTKENNHLFQCVLAAGDGYYKTHELEAYQASFLECVTFYIDDNGMEFRKVDQAVANKILNGENAIHQALKARQASQALKHINELVYKLSGTRPPRTDRTAKINMLKCSSLPADKRETCRIINEFMANWNYDQIIMQQYPAIVRFDLSKVQDEGRSKFYYYNRNETNRLHTYRRDQLKIPALGKTYWTLPEDKYNINFASHGAPNGVPHYKIHQWYEKDLPAELKRQKLKFTRVPIITKRRGRPRPAHAWKIISGVGKFKKRPLTMFSTGTELRLDCETLPRLQAAVDKFGGGGAALRVLNDLIIAHGTARLGSYTADDDQITLANQSLALLAHEGLHRLKAKGLIPNKEFQALVVAGGRLVQQVPTLAQHINQRDEHGRLRYPPGPARTEELAALFVESYYHDNSRARKSLMGQKIPFVERVLSYVAAVIELVAAHCGHTPALAKCFLRRVERGHYASLPQRTPRRNFPQTDYDYVRTG